MLVHIPFTNACLLLEMPVTLRKKIERLRQQLHNTPSDSHSRVYLAWHLLESGDRSNAIVEFFSAIASLNLEPKNDKAIQDLMSAHYGIGCALYETGDIDQAREHCASALELYHERISDPFLYDRNRVVKSLRRLMSECTK